jgi:hypothetical protein
MINSDKNDGNGRINVRTLTGSCFLQRSGFVVEDIALTTYLLSGQWCLSKEKSASPPVNVAGSALYVILST